MKTFEIPLTGSFKKCGLEVVYVQGREVTLTPEGFSAPVKAILPRPLSSVNKGWTVTDPHTGQYVYQTGWADRAASQKEVLQSAERRLAIAGEGRYNAAVKRSQP